MTTSLGTSSGKRTASSTMPKRRVDVVALKQELTEALKEKAAIYFDTLKKYFAGKLSKREHDHFLKRILGEHVRLHNRFITALHANTKRPGTAETKGRLSHLGMDVISEGIAPDQPSNSLGGSTKRIDFLLTKDYRITRAERSRFRSILLRNFSQKKRDTLGKFGRSTQITPLMVDQASKIHRDPDLFRPFSQTLCVDKGGLLSFPELKRRILRRCLENGLSQGVSNDCVKFLDCAIQSHLKTIISSCVNKVHRIEVTDKSANNSPIDNEPKTIAKEPINVTDMELCLRLNPWLLVEDNAAMERLLLEKHS